MTRTGKATVSLPTDRQILIAREIGAPRDLVWKAWTTPELVRQWWVGRRGEAVSCDIDLRVGGKWRYVMIADSNGQQVAFNGEYREVVANERLVSTEVFEDHPDEIAVNILTLTDNGAGTRFEILVEHTSTFARDMHVNSGMEGGMQEALDLLEEVAVSL